jgi:hypothetical protein
LLSELCHTARHLGATLNWRRDPDYEQRKMQHEWRMKQLESELSLLRQENAKGRQLLARIDALCFPPESSSIPAIATEPGSKPSSP